MPNTKAVRSFQVSGTKVVKSVAPDIPVEGVSPKFNSTYPSNEMATIQVMGRDRNPLPTTQLPLGVPDLGSVSTGGK